MGLSLVGVGACFHPVAQLADGGVIDLPPVGSQRCLTPMGMDSHEVCVTVAPTRCGGTLCGERQLCCEATGTCIDPIQAATACPAPSSTTTQGARPCASRADCTSDEYCETDDRNRCVAGGHCQPLNLCGSCSAVGSTRCQVCGCNGVTYESVQAACVAGMRVAVSSDACGQPSDSAGGGRSSVGCGMDSQCASTEQCCALTGRCYASADPWRCQLQPDGGLLDCANDAECQGGQGGGGGGSSCAGTGCGTPGTCRPSPSTSSCSGEVATVCGCNGRSYTNECWARAAGTRVASAGACDGG